MLFEEGGIKEFDLYQNMWFGGLVFSMLGGQEQVEIVIPFVWKPREESVESTFWKPKEEAGT